MQRRATHWRTACAAAIACAFAMGGFGVRGAVLNDEDKEARTPPAYDVDVSVDLDAGTWSGRETIRYVQRSRIPAREVVLNLYPNAGAMRADTPGAATG